MELATVEDENCTPCHRHLDELPMMLEHEVGLMVGRCVTRLPKPHQAATLIGVGVEKVFYKTESHLWATIVDCDEDCRSSKHT